MQLILLVNWYRIDWFIWLPVILLLLFLVMVILRIIRWKTRWAPVQISHVQETILEFEGDQIALYFYEPPKTSISTSKDSHSIPICLLIPPLGVMVDKSELWSTSIAMLGWRVLTLKPDHIQKWLLSENSNLKTIKKLIDQFQITHIILFDYAITPMLNSWLAEPQIQGKKILLCRPTLNWNDVRSIWSFIPFTSKWRARLRLSRFQKGTIRPATRSTRDMSLENIAQDQIQKFFQNNRFSIIEPRNTWLTKTGQERWIEWKTRFMQNKIDLEYQFTQGNWDFYFQETLLSGVFTRFLSQEE